MYHTYTHILYQETNTHHMYARYIYLYAGLEQGQSLDAGARAAQKALEVPLVQFQRLRCQLLTINAHVSQ